MSGTQKHWISAQDLLEDALRLATRVRESGFRPDVVIGLWRGGAAVAVAVHEALRFHGIDAAHMPVVTRLYSGIDRRAGELLIEGLERLQPILAMPSAHAQSPSGLWQRLWRAQRRSPADCHHHCYYYD